MLLRGWRKLRSDHSKWRQWLRRAAKTGGLVSAASRATYAGESGGQRMARRGGASAAAISSAWRRRLYIRRLGISAMRKPLFG